MFEARFQTFRDRAEKDRSAARIAALRQRLAALALDGFIVPRADEHQGEYIPAAEQRLAWLTGFTGSAGIVVILADEAAIFVDGRYTLQVADQVDTAVVTPVAIAETTPEAWLERRLGPGARLGYDPRLHTPDMVRKLSAAAASTGAELVAVDDNPIDVVWTDRPAPPAGQVRLHDGALAGATTTEKTERVRAALAEARLAALLVSDPHAVAWLFNIRGADVKHTPLTLGYALIPAEGQPILFMDGRKLSNSVRDALASAADIREPHALPKSLSEIAGGGARIRLDQASAGENLRRLVEAAGGKADVGPDPIALMKAVKNGAEIAGARAAQLRDGAAMIRFLAWFDREAPSGKLTEIDAVAALEHFRRETGALLDVSFPTIAGAGPNAAIPHYRVTTESNRPITPGIFLIDSGAQYLDGTTDITRTLAVGRVTRQMKDRFTRVLKGHIAIARAVFPKGTSGAQIDSFARQSLWEAGLDFDHGTGHGIGSYLSVHEGPQRIAKTGTVALDAGMMLSNEPGYYAAGRFGIRIENLILVEPRQIAGAEREMLGFETLTLAPIDRRLISLGLLTRAERAWIDDYHARVHDALGSHVDLDTQIWLSAATAPL